MTIYNQVSMIGTLTHELEKKTHNGRSFVSFQLALNKRWTDKESGEERNYASFIPVTAWGKTADHIASSFIKGSFIMISGEMRSSSWETDSGEKRSLTFVQARHAVDWNNAATEEAQKETPWPTALDNMASDLVDPDDIPF